MVSWWKGSVPLKWPSGGTWALLQGRVVGSVCGNEGEFENVLNEELCGWHKSLGGFLQGFFSLYFYQVCIAVCDQGTQLLLFVSDLNLQTQRSAD